MMVLMMTMMMMTMMMIAMMMIVMIMAVVNDMKSKEKENLHDWDQSPLIYLHTGNGKGSVQQLS